SVAADDEDPMRPRERAHARVELFEEAPAPARARHADRQETEARVRAHRRHVRERDGQSLVAEVARRTPSRPEPEVNVFDEQVCRDYGVEARALSQNGGVVADALQE